MIKYNIRIENVLDKFIPIAIENELDIEIEPTFTDNGRQECSCIMRRVTDNRFGIISVNVQEYPDDSIVYFVFNPKLYEYAKAEGFDRDAMVCDLSVFKKVTQEVFFDHLLSMDE